MFAKQNSFRETSQLDNPKTKKDTYVSAFRSLQNKDNSDEITKRLVKIYNKLQAGKELCATEMEFLREHSPETYEKAVKIQKEREEHRQALRNAKTKDDVRLIQAQKMSQVMSEVKAASATEHGDRELPFLQMKAAAMVNEFVSFTETENYDKKPNEYELVIEMMEKQKKLFDNANEIEDDGNLIEDESEFEFGGEIVEISQDIKEQYNSETETTVNEFSDISFSYSDDKTINVKQK